MMLHPAGSAGKIVEILISVTFGHLWSSLVISDLGSDRLGPAENGEGFGFAIYKQIDDS